MDEKMWQALGGVKTELQGTHLRLDGVDKRLDSLETTTRKIAITVAGHTEMLSRINAKLGKLDALDAMSQRTERFMAEIMASRNERILMGHSFADQQATLTDHELRLTRLELRGKQS